MYYFDKTDEFSAIYRWLFSSNHIVQYLSKKHNLPYENAIGAVLSALKDSSVLNRILYEILPHNIQNIDPQDLVPFLWKKALFLRYEWLDRLFTPQKSPLLYDNPPNKEEYTLQLYHYTSLESCQKILETKKILFRNRGFNDPSENIPKNVFVASFSLLKDHPTLFRLYGDNTKGVCIEFELTLSNNQDRSKYFPFLMHYEENEAPKMNSLRESLLKKSNLELLDPTYTIFRKSVAYQDEHEVRLVNRNNEGTDLQEETALIDLSQLYLQPKCIILGSSCGVAENTLGIPTQSSQFKFALPKEKEVKDEQ